MSDHFTIAVLGAGPGGYVAALKAAQMGAATVLIEKSHLGGTCLNNGCIPSKALLASAELLHQVRHAAEMGLDVPAGAVANWAAIQARKDKIVQTLRAGIKSLLAGRKVTVLAGTGILDAPGRLVVQDAGGARRLVSADKVILAPGSVPATIPGWPADPQLVCTSDQALHWPELPRSVLIVGGGAIGCEFACLLQALGVEVTIVEMLPALLPNVEAALAEHLTRIFGKRGIACHTGVKVDDLKPGPAGLEARLSDGTIVKAQKVLVATGRRPATSELGLDRAGLSTDHGFVRVDDHMRTPVAGHYCIGDANGRCLLAHAASAQGIAAVEDALGHGRPLTAPVPNCVYTFPEIASVGLTTEQARAAGLPIAIGQFPLAGLGKALAAGQREGVVRIVRHRETDEILGVHMIGHHATECIAAAGALLATKAAAADAAHVIFAHPTMAEALKEGLEDALGMGLHLAPRKVVRVAV
jgi:dihydrolipoamide dehydrogenase